MLPAPHSRVPDAIAVALIGAALWLALQTVDGLTWPPRPDFYRELGSAQTILDGRPLEDPVYLGEAQWYNPLVPLLLAATATRVDVPLHEWVVRLGPWFNLLGPIAFYLLVSRVFFGPWIGVASLAVYLFAFSPLLPPSVEGSYSPWLWTRNFMQGPTFLATAALLLCHRARRWLPWSLCAGALLGLVFLGHTAPAVMLATLALGWGVVEAARAANAADRRRAVLRLATVGGTALAVSLPFLLHLWSAYRLEVANDLPMLHVALPIRHIALGMLSLSSVMALLGAVGLWRLPESLGIPRRRRNELLALFAAIGVWLGYGVLHQGLKHLGVVTPQVLPAFHFHLYYKAFEAIVAGVGFAYLASLLAPALRSRFGDRVWPQWLSERHVFVALVALTVLLQIDSFEENYDRVLFREEAIERAARTDMIELYEFALEKSEPDDVFLCPEDFALYAVSPAARKVIVSFDVYSNPYVPYEPRRRDRDALYTAIRRGDVATFRELADRHRLRYVVDADRAMPCCPLDDAVVDRFPALERVFRREGIGVYRVVEPRPIALHEKG